MRDEDEHTDDQYHDHMRRIRDIIDQWRNDEISLTRKRKLIADENKAYYRQDTKSPVTNEWLTRAPRVSDPAAVIADAQGLPLEAVTAALAARRRANWEAAHHAADLDEARDMIASGLRGYQDIIAAARPSVASG